MKILVAASGRHEGSGDPVSAAGSFPWPEGSEFRVLAVAPVVQPAVVGVMGETPAVVSAADVQLKADALAEDAATQGAMQLRERGFQAEGITIEGDPEGGIVDYAKQWGADLIVVGSHDRSRMERLFLGSISQDIVKHSSCSVLVVKQRAAA